MKNQYTIARLYINKFCAKSVEITIQNIQRISLREISGSESESESKYCIDWIHLDKNTKHLLLLLRAKTLLSLNSKLTQGHRLTLSVKIYTKKLGVKGPLL